MSSIETSRNDELKVYGDVTGYVVPTIINTYVNDSSVGTPVDAAHPFPVSIKNLSGTSTPESSDDILHAKSIVITKSFSDGSSSASGSIYPTSEILLDGEHRVPLNIIPVDGGGDIGNLGTGKTLAFAQVTVGTSAIVVSNDGTASTGKRGVTIKNHGAQETFVGDVGVTTSNGYRLKTDESVTINTMCAVYCRCAASTTTVSVIEF